MEIREYLRIILTHKRLIIFLSLVTAIVATAGSFLKTTKYEATTTVLIKSSQANPQIPVPEFVAFQNIQTKGETFGKLLKSRVVSEKIVKILGLDGSLSPKNVKGLIKSIQKSISTTLVSKTSMLEILVIYHDPKLSADIANAAAKVFVDYTREMTSAEAIATTKFIAGRVKVAEDDLKTAQDNFREFIIREGTVYPESKTNLVLTELVHFETSLKNTRAEIDQTKINLQKIHEKLAEYNKTLKSSTTTIVNPLIQDLKTKLVNLEIQCSNLSVDYGPLHPKILALEEESKKIKASLESEVKRIIETEVTTVNPIYQQLLSDLISKETHLCVCQEKEKAIVEIIKRFPKELAISAEKQIEWDTLTSAVKFAQKNLDSLKSQLEAARIAEAQKISEISLVDQALVPLKPKGLPKAGYPFLGILVGLMGGIGLAFFLEYIDDSVKTIETIEEELKLSVYGIIPEIKLQNKKTKRKDTRELDETSKMAERLVTHFEPRSPIAEAYRSFRTNIQFAGIKAKTGVFLITSSLKSEGKTTTAANLCITLAQLGSKTLLIDADMRNPTLHSIFGKQKEPGLSNFIVGVSDLNEIIVPSGVEDLDIITSGPIPPNPSELLSSERANQLVEKIKDNYDFILFDSPPVIAVTDAVILSSKVDGVFLVIHAGKSSKGICLRAKILLEKVNANILGAVLNNVKVESGYGYEYYYQYHYGEGKKKEKET